MERFTEAGKTDRVRSTRLVTKRAPRRLEGTALMTAAAPPALTRSPDRIDGTAIYRRATKPAPRSPRVRKHFPHDRRGTSCTSADRPAPSGTQTRCRLGQISEIAFGKFAALEAGQILDKLPQAQESIVDLGQFFRHQCRVRPIECA